MMQVMAKEKAYKLESIIKISTGSMGCFGDQQFQGAKIKPQLNNYPVAAACR